MLATFLTGRRAVLPVGGIEVRVGLELTDDFEKSLVVGFVEAAAVSALLLWAGYKYFKSLEKEFADIV